MDNEEQKDPLQTEIEWTISCIRAKFESAKKAKNTNKWTQFCGKCFQVEKEKPLSNKDGELITCQGKCYRSFHVGCIDEKNKEKKFICDECKTESYSCLVCNIADDKVFKCSSDECHRHYHAACLRPFTLSHILSDEMFECPAHMCGTCLRPLARNQATVCTLCPISYHHGPCVPPGLPLPAPFTMVCCRHFVSHKHANNDRCKICFLGGSLVCCVCD
eukprot:c24483_g1_i1.p1 GENE.c24483_g1_i1~~c24483_g1_i1.p1  ORF type:complete len:246 (-),score=94.26 c24483_g1_i1:5-658(-)